MSRRPLIAGNWKMNGLVQDGSALADGLMAGLAEVDTSKLDLLVCPPFTLISIIAATLAGSRIQVGAQDCHSQAKGAHTGDISAAMLVDLGCSQVIVGHSERRTDHGETDGMVRSKAEAGRGAGLTAIICIGETEAERDAGKTLDVVRRQLAESLPDGCDGNNTVIAYEPVWAIGTGRTPTTAEVQEVHGEIRACLSARFGDESAQAIRILYGGSMKPENAAELLALPDVDGGLIGGASLKADDFLSIARNCP